MFKDKFPKDFDILKDLKTHYLMSYSSDNKKLLTHSANLEKSFLDELKIQFESKYDLPIETFETEKEIDDKVYLFLEKDKAGLKFYKEILTLLNIKKFNIDNAISQANKIPNPSKLKFIISHFETKSNDHILIFTRQDRIGIPNKKKAFKFNGKEDFKEVTIDDIYLFNTFPTCIFINEEIYVIDYKGFIEIFQYKEHLKNHVNDVVDMLESSSIITNMNHFKDSFKKYRFFNALTKIDKDPKNVSQFVKSNANDIEKITREYEVNFKYDSKNNNFEIGNEEGIKILVRLLSDRTGFNLAKDFILYPTRETINRKKTKKPK
ncbi:Kiwa anti-phage protein KwaB-like domain-containing protein [Lysinibacillus capsici]|uniref:Kiwa anti-phage protein KwaB-like domain-containing protein n=1 Tax=Lysinibacillus capsici TaxID=2115968 RepID=UPI003F21CFD0